MSNSLWAHELQHTRFSCPSPSPGVCSNACPLSQWCHPTISSSASLFSSCSQSFPASRSFPMNQLFTSGGQSIAASASASVLPMNIQGWFPLGLTCLISLLSRGLSRVFSNTAIRKHQFFGTQPSLWFSSHIFGLPDSSVGKESTCNAGDPGLIPGLGRSTGEAIGYPLRYSWASLVAQLVKNLPIMRETWVRSLGWEYPLEKGKAEYFCIVHGVIKSQIQMSYFHFLTSVHDYWKNHSFDCTDLFLAKMKWVLSNKGTWYWKAACLTLSGQERFPGEEMLRLGWMRWMNEWMNKR